ncbi:hypothetical protein [Microbulbifer halophilus]|uniref:Transposase IS200-like domain-containing protein n=1 Tax=Microbulbifer halophilus TaxID=453963 RepID=A0ABW5EIP8_9GAMM|nr:hypothetical protein [Microbulbifer halophilus]MCW8128391.1 hypothetical protein [Microbulbifer halophilus]
MARIFAPDVCAYAVMGNHYHVVLHVNAVQAADWELPGVVARLPRRVMKKSAYDVWLPELRSSSISGGS